MNKTCFVLIIVIVAICPASLFAGETMITRTTQTTTTGCNFRVDKCETSVATDPSYMHFKDGPSIPGPADVGPALGDSSYYRSSSITFRDYPAPQPTVEELLALIRKKLSNCPEVDFTFDDTTGDITLSYLHSSCGCEWTVNIRDIKADDFVWQRTTDNYSERLGQMERRKFHCVSQQDAQDIESAFSRICAIKGWLISED